MVQKVWYWTFSWMINYEIKLQCNIFLDVVGNIYSSWRTEYPLVIELKPRMAVIMCQSTGSIDSGNGLSHAVRQAITSTNAELLSIGALLNIFSEIRFETQVVYWWKRIEKICLRYAVHLFKGIWVKAKTWISTVSWMKTVWWICISNYRCIQPLFINSLWLSDATWQFVKIIACRRIDTNTSTEPMPSCCKLEPINMFKVIPTKLHFMLRVSFWKVVCVIPAVLCRP